MHRMCNLADPGAGSDSSSVQTPDRTTNEELVQYREWVWSCMPRLQEEAESQVTGIWTSLPKMWNQLEQQCLPMSDHPHMYIHMYIYMGTPPISELVSCIDTPY